MNDEAGVDAQVIDDSAKMDRNLALEAVRVTEAAALAASRLMGRGDEKAADQAAVDAMRRALKRAHLPRFAKAWLGTWNERSAEFTPP